MTNTIAVSTVHKVHLKPVTYPTDAGYFHRKTVTGLCLHDG